MSCHGPHQAYDFKEKQGGGGEGGGGPYATIPRVPRFGGVGDAHLLRPAGTLELPKAASRLRVAKPGKSRDRHFLGIGAELMGFPFGFRLERLERKGYPQKGYKAGIAGGSFFSGDFVASNWLVALVSAPAKGRKSVGSFGFLFQGRSEMPL